MDWSSWIGLSIFVKLKRGGVYSGLILDYDENLKLFSIRDKYGQRVCFNIDSIEKIKEENF